MELVPTRSGRNGRGEMYQNGLKYEHVISLSSLFKTYLFFEKFIPAVENHLKSKHLLVYLGCAADIFFHKWAVLRLYFFSMSSSCDSYNTSDESRSKSFEFK